MPDTGSVRLGTEPRGGTADRSVESVHDPHDWLTQRQVALLLHEEIGVHRETARRLLAAGLLGKPRTTSLADFYRRDALDAFLERHRARGPLPDRDRHLVVVRVGNGRVHFGAEVPEHRDRLATGWRMSPKWRALITMCSQRAQPVGLLVTIGGFVVAGADIAAAEWAGQEGLPPGDPMASPLLTRFDLDPPGAWYDEWRGYYLPTGRGGAALRVWPLGGRLHTQGSNAPPWEWPPVGDPRYWGPTTSYLPPGRT